MEYGYERVSTSAQDTLGQRQRLLGAGVEKIYTDEGVSGMKASRPQFDLLLSALAEGDRLTVVRLDRIGRSVVNVLKVIEDLDAAGVRLRILDMGGEQIDTGTAMGRFFLTISAAFGRLERDMISSRTRDALAARKAAGVRLGAVPKVTGRDVSAMKAMRDRGVPVAEIARTLDLGRSTVYRVLAS
jgi:DNA invertase Pin-like site-specific DNA recombinase